jgi:hypothetical protein
MYLINRYVNSLNIIKKEGRRLWIGFIRLKIGTNGRPGMKFRVPQRAEISSEFEQLMVSQERLIPWS